MSFSMSRLECNACGASLRPCKVMSGVYRSGFPAAKNERFLEHLGLRTVLYIGSEPHGRMRPFYDERGIALHCIPVGHNRMTRDTVFECLNAAALREVLAIVRDPGLRPLLVHDDRGSHRVGCVVGCLRKLQGWAVTSAFAEYRRFARTNGNFMDEQLIALFDDAGQ